MNQKENEQSASVGDISDLSAADSYTGKSEN